MSVCVCRSLRTLGMPEKGREREREKLEVKGKQYSTYLLLLRPLQLMLPPPRLLLPTDSI